MTTETVLNINALIPYFCGIGFILLIGIALFLLHNLGGLKLFSKHDNDLVEKFLAKYPLVSVDFLQKTAREQTVENNQEIHELRLENEQLKEFIQKELNAIKEVLKGNGKI